MEEGFEPGEDNAGSGYSSFHLKHKYLNGFVSIADFKGGNVYIQSWQCEDPVVNMHYLFNAALDRSPFNDDLFTCFGLLFYRFLHLCISSLMVG